MCGPANATRTIVHLNVVDLRDGVRWNVIDAPRLSCVYVCVCVRARANAPLTTPLVISYKMLSQ